MLIKNQKGVALVYVLMSLVFVGAIGMLIINISTKEMTDTSLRASTESTRFSANAGLTEAVNVFTDTTNSALEAKAFNYLKHWYDNYKEGKSISNIQKQYKWLIGDSSTFVDTNGMKYRVEIVNIDFSGVEAITENDPNNPGNSILIAGKTPEDSPVIISLRSESIDSTGSRSVSEGSYKIIGFEDKEFSSQVPQSALYLGTGVDEIDVPVTVDGSTFFKGGGHINESGHIFGNEVTGGEFRRRGTAGEIMIRGATFNGPAYFGEAEGQNGNSVVQFQSNKSFFKKGLAAESKIDFNGSIGADIYMGAFFNNNAVFSNQWNGLWRFSGDNTRLRGLNGKTYKSNGVNNITGLFSAGVAPTTYSIENYEMNLFDSLGIPENDPPPVSIDFTDLPTVEAVSRINNKINSVTGDDLNEHYNSASKYKDWMLVRFHPNGRPFDSGGATGFSKKMILFVDSQTAGSGFGTQFYKSAPEGRSLIIIEESVNDKLDGFGNNALICGLIVNLGGGNLILRSSGPNMEICGAVYSVGSGKTTLHGGSGNRITFRYCEDVLKDIVDDLAGVVIYNNGGGEISSDFSRIPKSILPKTTSNMQSRSF